MPPGPHLPLQERALSYPLEILGKVTEVHKDAVALFLPSGAVPDLEMIFESDEGDLLIDPRVLSQRRGEKDPSGGVYLKLCSHRKEHSSEIAGLFLKGGKIFKFQYELFPSAYRIKRDTAVYADGGNNGRTQLSPESGRQYRSALAVQFVFIAPHQHVLFTHFAPLYSTLSHIIPNDYTTQYL